jgi:ech hydrogenase subunit D
MDGATLLAKAGEYHDGGWRLVLINATAVLPSDELADGAFDVSWSFARGSELEHLRERVQPGEEVPSISNLFGGAFIFENEMRELFGVNVTGIAIDLQGQLFKTSERVPFAPSAIRARLDAVRPPKPPKAEKPAVAPAPAEAQS